MPANHFFFLIIAPPCPSLWSLIQGLRQVPVTGTLMMCVVSWLMATFQSIELGSHFVNPWIGFNYKHTSLFTCSKNKKNIRTLLGTFKSPGRMQTFYQRLTHRENSAGLGTSYCVLRQTRDTSSGLFCCVYLPKEFIPRHFGMSVGLRCLCLCSLLRNKSVKKGSLPTGLVLILNNSCKMAEIHTSQTRQKCRMSTRWKSDALCRWWRVNTVPWASWGLSFLSLGVPKLWVSGEWKVIFMSHV